MKAREFEHTVSDAIGRDRLLTDDGAPVIAGLSGGADSVALVAVLTALGYTIMAAHCNFHLRGAESNRDRDHAARVAQTLGIDLFIRDFNVQQRMEATSESVEMAARALRYDWFASLLEHEHAQAVAVGHHREDQAETFLLNALRGTGIAGLAAMAPRSGNVIRPLLGVSRADIEQYLKDRGLSFVTDSTNASDAFLRNSLRNRVLPAMEHRFPDTPGRLLSTTRQVRDNLALYSWAVDRLAGDFMDRDANVVDISAMRTQMPPAAARTLLFEMLRPLGFNMTHAANIIKASSGVFTAGGTVAELLRGKLFLRAAAARDSRRQTTAAPDVHEISLRSDITVPVHITVREMGVAAFHPERDARVMYLDAAVLGSGCRFVLRHPRRGDRIQPFGMTGTRLVSDILTEAHLTPSQKRAAWLLTIAADAGEGADTVLWVLGHRASAHYPVTPATRRFLTLRLP